MVLDVKIKKKTPNQIGNLANLGSGFNNNPGTGNNGEKMKLMDSLVKM